MPWVSVWYTALREPLGPTPYLQLSASPFAAIDFSNGYFHLENFEDGVLDTPGITASSGRVARPASNTDSVDGDDGNVDGFGTRGHSFFFNSGSQGIRIHFDAAVLDPYPPMPAWSGPTARAACPSRPLGRTGLLWAPAVVIHPTEASRVRQPKIASSAG